jgi:hypothetical protein
LFERVLPVFNIKRVLPLFKTENEISWFDLPKLLPACCLEEINLWDSLSYYDMTTITLNNAGTLALIAFEKKNIDGRLPYVRHYLFYDFKSGMYASLEPEIFTNPMAFEGIHRNRYFKETVKFNEQDDLFIGNNDIFQSSENSSTEYENRLFSLDFSKYAPGITFSELYFLTQLFQKDNVLEYIKSADGMATINTFVNTVADQDCKKSLMKYFAISQEAS